ncbi:MAG TPA: methyltransferase domain-containing protein, partial [Anaerolineales bacterium]
MRINKEKQLSQNEIALIYDELFKGTGRLRDSDALYNWVLDRLKPTAGSKLLDVACGEGLLVKAARQRDVLGIGVDLSAQGVKLAKHRLGVAVLSIGNGESLPFAEQSFDFVTNIGSLEHFADPPAGIREMVRVLKPGGRVALLLPNSYYLIDLIWQVWRTGYGPSHNQPLEIFATFREWWELIEKYGLVVLKAYKYNFCFPRSKADIHWYQQHPRKVLNLLVSPFVPF